MTRRISNLLFRSPIRWLATAGAAATLIVPLAASADHQNNDLVGIVASAAVAYVVVDAVGGFDNDKHRRHKRDRDYYRDQRGHDRHASRGHRNGYDHWGYNRAHRARIEHRRQHAYGGHQRKHRQDHRRHHDQHRNHHRKSNKQHRAYH